MFKQDTIRTLVRFGLVGGLVTLVNSGLIWYFYTVVGLGARTSFWVGYFPALILHFCLTKWWTFRCQRRDLIRQCVRYGLTAATMALVQFGIYHATLLWLTPIPNLAYLISAALGMGLSFVLMRRKVFQPATPASENAV